MKKIKIMQDDYDIESSRPQKKLIEVKMWRDDSYYGMVQVETGDKMKLIKYLDEYGSEIQRDVLPNRLTDKFLTENLPVRLLEAKNQLNLFD